MLIFKIVHAREWRDAERIGEYCGSDKDHADGYLHFSSAEQLVDTLAKYYTGHSNLVLVAVDSEEFGSELKFEKSRSGALFAHLYGALPVIAVKWTKSLWQNAGQVVLPDLTA